MRYMLLIHQGDAPTPESPEEWGRLSEDEQKQVYAAYQALNQTPGVSPGSDDIDAAIELAARIPAVAMGGAVEVRPVREQYERALELVSSEPERRVLEARLAELTPESA